MSPEDLFMHGTLKGRPDLIVVIVSDSSIK